MDTPSDLGVRVIRPHERDAYTTQTIGLQRFGAISRSQTGASEIWMGYATLPPGSRTDVHHHGESETGVYIISGLARWVLGDTLDSVVEAEPGDFVFIPPHVLHYEENASEMDSVEMIVARSSDEAIVINRTDPPGGRRS